MALTLPDDRLAGRGRRHRRCHDARARRRDATCTAVVLVKEAGVVCGLEAARTVFAELGVGFEPVVGEGTSIDRARLPSWTAPRAACSRASGWHSTSSAGSGIATSRAATSTRSPAPARHPRHAQDDARPARPREARRRDRRHEPPLRPRRRRAREGQPPAADRHHTGDRRPARRYRPARRNRGGHGGAGARRGRSRRRRDSARQHVDRPAARGRCARRRPREARSLGRREPRHRARSPRPESTSSPSARSPIRPAHSMFPWRCSRDHANDRPNAGRGEGAGA